MSEYSKKKKGKKRNRKQSFLKGEAEIPESMLLFLGGSCLLWFVLGSTRSNWLAASLRRALSLEDSQDTPIETRPMEQSSSGLGGTASF